MLNLAALEQTSVHVNPFPFLAVPNFIDENALERIEKDYPAVSQPGSFPLETLRFGPAFANFMAELRQPRFRSIVGSKLGIELAGRPATITVRGRARERDGQIHLDSKSKLVTVLIYMNGRWEADGGRLRLLNSPTSLDDMVMEVPPGARNAARVPQHSECVARTQTLRRRAARDPAQLGARPLGSLAREGAA